MIHSGLLQNERWIIDGFGCVASAWERFATADTLVYVDLQLVLHYLWVTKRFIKGILVNPEGWPANSPMWRGTLAGYRVIPLCHRHMTPKYRQLVAEAAAAKRVHHYGPILSRPPALSQAPLSQLHICKERATARTSK
jgi:hypothetical protein